MSSIRKVLRASAATSLLAVGLALVPAAAAQAKTTISCTPSYPGNEFREMCTGSPKGAVEFRAVGTCYRASHANVKEYGPYTYDGPGTSTTPPCPLYWDMGSGTYEILV
jgi:hypothetical protein